MTIYKRCQRDALLKEGYIEMNGEAQQLREDFKFTDAEVARESLSLDRKNILKRLKGCMSEEEYSKAMAELKEGRAKSLADNAEVDSRLNDAHYAREDGLAKCVALRKKRA